MFIFLNFSQTIVKKWTKKLSKDSKKIFDPFVWLQKLSRKLSFRQNLNTAFRRKWDGGLSFLQPPREGARGLFQSAEFVLRGTTRRNDSSRGARARDNTINNIQKRILLNQVFIVAYTQKEIYFGKRQEIFEKKIFSGFKLLSR